MPPSPNAPRLAAGLAAILLALLTAGPSHAQSLIRQPGNHPSYSFEAEPHLAVDPFGDAGIGPGFRGTVVIVDNGFVSSINNSVGIGFGADFLFYGDGGNGRGGDDRTELMLPAVMQWSFWLHRSWSVFGEPGVIVHFRGGQKDDLGLSWFTVFGGGRYHFSDAVSLTMRVGAPLVHRNTLSVGVSFLL